MTKTTLDEPLMQSIFFQVAGNLGLIVDREIEVEEIQAERAAERTRGADHIHISFKLAFDVDGEARHGCLLVPLTEAVTLAACLTMLPNDLIQAARKSEELDETAKDAMMELGNLVSGAVSEALRESDMPGIRVSSEGCQGVRADAPPALLESAGTEYAVGRAQARIEGYPSSDWVVLLPVFW